MITIDNIRKNPLIAIIRKADEQTIIPIVESLYNGGIKSIELTAETTGILNLIEKVKKHFENDILLGAGSVLDPETARSVIVAGADFIVSPTLNVETIKMAKRYGILNISGGLTPTEILTAYENGADMVKVFPANVVGPPYIKDIHGPLPQIPIMVTGGITLENLNEYFRQGGEAVGIGSNLVNVNALKNGDDFTQLEKRARAFVEARKLID